MSIEELRITKKDKYLAADVVCTHCGVAFKKSVAFYCPGCKVKIFDRDRDGQTVIIDPNTAGRSRKYKVTESSGEESEHYPGELVTVRTPFLTDHSYSVTADGTELLYENEDGFLTSRFLMPEHDVRVEKSCVNNMVCRQPMNGMGNMGGIGKA